MAERREIILEIKARAGDLAKRVAEINRELYQQAERLKELRRLHKAKKLTDEQFIQMTAATKKSQKDLRVELRDVTRQLDLQKRATEAADGSNEKLRAELSLLTREYNKLGAEEREGTEAGKRLKRATRELSDEIKRNERAVGDNRREVGNYENALRGAAGKLLGGAGLIFGLSSLADIAQKVGRIFVEFGDKLAKLQAISGASSEQMTMLEGEARRLGETTQFTASQVLDLQTNFARVGMSPDQIMAATAATLDLAVATGEDLATAAEVAAGTLGGYRLQAADTQRVNDVMAKAFNSSALNLDRFRESTKLVAPIAANAGIEIEEVTGALGVLADASIHGSQAGTGLRRILAEMSNENSKLAQRVGFAVTSSEDFTRALKILGAEQLSNTDATALVGKMHASTLSALVASADGAVELGAALRDSSGAAAEAAKVVGDTLQGDLFKAQSALEGVAITIGAALEPVLRATVQGFVTFIGWLKELPRFLSDNRVELAALAAGIVLLNIAQIKAAASALSLAIAQKGQMIATRAATVAQWAMNAAMSANPIGIIIGLLAALAVAISQAYKRSETFRKVVDATWAGIKAAAGAIWDVVVPVFEGIRDAIGTAAGAVRDYFAGVAAETEQFRATVGRVFERIGDLFGRFIRYQIDGFKTLITAFGRVRAFFAGTGAAIRTILGNLAQGILDQFGGLGQMIAGIFTLDVDKIKAGFADLRAGIVASTADIGRGAAAAYRDAFNESQQPGIFAAGIEAFREGYARRLRAEAAEAGTDAATEVEAAVEAAEPAATVDVVVPTPAAIKDKIEEAVKTAAAGIQRTSFELPPPELDQDLAQAEAEQEVADAAELERTIQAAITHEEEEGLRQRQDAKYAERLDDLQRERETAATNAEIARQEATERKQAISSVGAALQDFGSLFKEESILSKAIAVGNAVVNTYLAATRALASAEPPRNFIMMGATIASGLVAVAKIAGVQFAEGGLVGGGNIPRQPNGDNVLATVKTGEVVLTQQQQASLGGANTFRRIGVPGFATGGLVSASGGAAARGLSAGVETRGDMLDLAQALRSMPAPVVSVRDIVDIQSRVSVKEQLTKL
jgi:TP901 family phage tail tape measure protein